MNPNIEGDEMFLLAAHMSRIVKVLQKQYDAFEVLF